ncbi:MAG: hypothetical protein IJT94_06350 [Oscillibacter sp.]|nr:hypothetical protein [Oscillibacter sp.]
MDQIHALNVSVEKLAASVERMVEEQKQQGQRLTVIENRDGESWRNLVGYGITALAGIILGLAFNHLGL